MSKKTKYCVVCDAPLTNEFIACPVCNKKDPFSESYQFQSRDPLYDMFNGVRNKIQEIKRIKAEQQRQKRMQMVKIAQNMFSSMDDFSQLGENIGEALSDGTFDFGELIDVASDVVNIYSKITGKGTNIAMALNGISGLSDGFGGILQDGFDLMDLSNFLEGGQKAIAGLTGHADIYENAQSALDGFNQVQIGFQTGNFYEYSKGIDQINEAFSPEDISSKGTSRQDITKDVIESIDGLKRLYDNGAITAREFEAKKKELLDKL